MFIINADTPEQMRDAIVQWMNDQASNKRRQAALASRVGTRTAFENAAATYSEAAEFIGNITVQGLRKLKT